MGSRILNITACCFVAVWPTALHGQGPDAQSVTQAVLDQHKSADPTNSARSLTARSGQFDISKIPPPSGSSSKARRSSPKTLQRIRELEKEQAKFLRKQAQTHSTEANFVQAPPGASAASDNGARVLSGSSMISASSAASIGRSPAAFNAAGVPPAGTMKSAGSGASTERSRAAFNAIRPERKVNQDWEKAVERKWEKSPDGKTLQRLKAEVAEDSKARRKTEFDISDVPPPRSSPR
jgi:hypothetical protein